MRKLSRRLTKRLDNLTIYGLRFGEAGYFHKGLQVVVGKLNQETFTCVSKSGSQNLWLPFKPITGLKLFHPKGPSGTAEKATAHYSTQNWIASKGLAPKAVEFLPLTAKFESIDAYFKPVETVVWDCLGVMMERVFSGGYAQISRNLEKFGCKKMYGLLDLLKPFGDEALNLRDYGILCMLFGGDPLKVQEMINDFEMKLPTNFNKGPDLLTPSNIVLDHFGECKLVDFDHCNI